MFNSSVYTGAVYNDKTSTTYTQNVGGGKITPTGAIGKLTSKHLSASISPKGTLSRTSMFTIVLSSVIKPVGGIGKVVRKALYSSIVPKSGITKQSYVNTGGSIAPKGTLEQSYSLKVTTGGSITPKGSLSKMTTKHLTGEITPKGTLSKTISKTLASTIKPVGRLTKGLFVTIGGKIKPVGVITRGFYKTISGTIKPSGSIATKYTKGDGQPEETLRLKLSRFLRSVKAPDWR